MQTQANEGKRMRRLRWLGLAALDAVTLAGTAPSVLRTVRELCGLRGSGTDLPVDRVALTLALTVVALTCCWLALGLLADLAAGLPGAAGAAARRVRARLLPRVAQ